MASVSPAVSTAGKSGVGVNEGWVRNRSLEAVGSPALHCRNTGGNRGKTVFKSAF